MNLVNEDLKLKLITGDPILLNKSNVFFYHRTIREVIQYGYIDFLRTIQLFKYSDNDIQEFAEIPGMSAFLYFLILLNNNSPTSLLMRQGLSFFIGANKVETDMEKQVLICSCKGIDNIEINKEGFEEITEYINLVYNGNFKEEDEDDSNLSEAERRMKEKFKRLKKMREAAKARSGDNEEISQFSDQLGGFWARNGNMRWSDILDLPYYTFYFLLKKLRIVDDYDIQLRAMMAGASIDKELHHWLMGDNDEDEKE